MSAKPEIQLTSHQRTMLRFLYKALLETEDIDKPKDVEDSITPLYNWLEGMFEEHPEEGDLM